jgi:phosphoglycolate phosphatase
MFRIALLDFDGTLAATRPAVVECGRQTLIQGGHRLPPDEVVEAVIANGMPLGEAFAAMAGELTGDEIERCVALYRQLYPEIDLRMSTLFPDVLDTMGLLAERGVAVAILSNKAVPAINTALTGFAAGLEVAAVIGEEPGAPNKPDPDVFHARVRAHFPDHPAEDFIMVGDTVTDLAFARAAGIRSCWAAYGYGEPEACRAFGPDHVIESFADIVRLAG